MNILPQLLINSLIAGAIYALIASGFSLIYSVVNFIHFAYGAIFLIAPYLAYTFYKMIGLPFYLAVIIAISGCAILGILIDQLIYKSLRSRKSANLTYLISSLGVFVFLQSLVQLIFGAEIKTLRFSPIQKGVEIFSAIITTNQLLILLTAFLILILLHLFLKRCRLGKAMRAISDDVEAAQICGIKPEKIIICTFALGSALAGIAGILIGLEQNLEPNMGMPAMLKGLTAAVIGGIGSVPGAMLGGFLLGLAENFGIWFLPSGYKDAIAFGILILFLLFKPQGLLGKKKRV